MRRMLTLALFLPALLPSPGYSQDACADIPKLFSTPPKIGQWAEFSWHQKGKEDASDRMRMAVIKEEKRGGKQMYWLQMVMTGKKDKPTIMQRLTPWDASSLGAQAPADLVVKIGDQPAMKMSKEMAKGAAAQADWREFCKDSKFIGTEAITVPAGTFPSRHYTSSSGDTWASPKAPVWHLVKMTTKEGKTMVLSAVGEGAKNEVTEQPVDLKTMMMRKSK
jgi:hypothetical protein